MLISIGQRERAEDLVGLLLECHERIRRFIRLAKDIAAGRDLPASEIIEASYRCERYFREALPLHVDDEELSILPRLQGRSAELDAALQAMRAQHVGHGPDLERLLGALLALQSAPDSQAAREELQLVATRLTRDFDEHLALEESVILPAVSTALSEDEQRAVLEELRARRR